jgi:hypothetical protein
MYKYVGFQGLGFRVYSSCFKVVDAKFKLKDAVCGV